MEALLADMEASLNQPLAFDDADEDAHRAALSETDVRDRGIG